MKKKNLKHFKRPEYLSEHFNKRCIERVGELLPRKEIVRRILNRDFDEQLSYVGKSSNKFTMYQYIHNNVPYAIVYDKRRHKVVTLYQRSIEDLMYDELIASYQIKIS